MMRRLAALAAVTLAVVAIIGSVTADAHPGRPGHTHRTTTTATTPVTVASSSASVTVLGFSQTQQWCAHTSFACVTASGADLRHWANWSSRVSGLTDYGAISGDVVLTISSTGGSRTPRLLQKAIDQLQARIPGMATLFLQPVVGDPGHTDVCGTRASQRHEDLWPYIVAGAAENAGVSAVTDPHVLGCWDYSDGLGHLADNGIREHLAAELELTYGG